MILFDRLDSVSLSRVYIDINSTLIHKDPPAGNPAGSDSCAYRKQEKAMADPKHKWDSIGPLPSNPELDEKLDAIVHSNRNEKNDEDEWLAAVKADLPEKMSAVSEVMAFVRDKIKRG